MGDGGTIPNLGQSQLNLSDASIGKDIQSVTRPLMSVGKICDNGMEILFDDKRAVIQDKSDSSELCVFERKPGRLYIGKFRLKAPSPGFPRQGR